MRKLRTYLLFGALCAPAATRAAASDSLPARRWWVPDHARLQFAGNIGFISGGFGYTNRKRRLEGDFYYGYVPRSVGGIAIHTVSSKLTWFPLRPLKAGRYEIRPLSAGILVAYTFGRQYFLFSPPHYAFDYYKFPTALHFGVFAGGDLSRRISPAHRLGLYYELGTTDKLMGSYVPNMRSLSPADIFSLALGLRYSW